MQKMQNINQQDDSDIKKVFELITRNYKLFIGSIILAIVIAGLVNHYSIPVYKVSSSMLIKEDSRPNQNGNVNEYINSNLFGTNQNFQNELWVLKSSPVIEQTIRNLDLQVSYFKKAGFQYLDAYESVPFKVLLLTDHIQPLNTKFEITIKDRDHYSVEAKAKEVNFQRIDSDNKNYKKEDWNFVREGKFGELIETSDLAFIIKLDSTKGIDFSQKIPSYIFVFNDINRLTDSYKQRIEFNVIEKDATVIEILLKSYSVGKAKDIINELMDVYSQQNLYHKNHLASITIDYIEKQLGEISDSLNQAENNLQVFRSSNQLLNVTEQASGISTQYRDLQNQLAELVTRKRYYDYVADYLSNKDDFSDIIVPASMGIQDQLLNGLMSELVTAQAQRSNLIKNNQERNPLVQKLTIQIENTSKTIAENIAAVRKTTDISIDEMNKRIRRVESEISRLPKTQQKLGGIERKYRLNDAIYNYLLEKRAEAKITQASNLPDNLIIEPAKMLGGGPVSPNKMVNLLSALLLGFAVPFGFLMFKSMLNNKIESQENIERLTEAPVLGKIMHNNKKTDDVMFEYPRSTIAESYRALRTNIEYKFKDKARKIILVTSSIEGEGKSFSALNIAMSYAQLNRRTILLDFDLRKNGNYFNKNNGSLVGISSYLTEHSELSEIIQKSPHEKLDYIPAGPIPPNPIELLANGKVKELIEILKESYDCIIMDSTPMAQVSDAYLLMDYSDIKIIVARYGYTLKKVFGLILKDLKSKNVNNVCVVLNDNRVYSDQYGYGYGYNNKKRKSLFRPFKVSK